jgi:hypothetical protein
MDRRGLSSLTRLRRFAAVGRDGRDFRERPADGLALRRISASAEHRQLLIESLRNYFPIPFTGM